MEKRILLTVSYDGTEYYGWQRQKNDAVPTIEGEMEECLSGLFKTPIDLIGASRTDRGVHALGQRAVFDVETSMPVGNMVSAINSVLPKSIAVSEAVEVGLDFHPRFDAVSKTYEYRILNSKTRNPILRNTTELVRYQLNLDKMKEAGGHLIGEHDFKGFCFSGNSTATTVRTIYSLDIKREGDIIIITVNGNGFLYNMVRIIAGTLVWVGMGKILPETIPLIIKSKDRSKSGYTAGPSGLTLLNISYKNNKKQ